MMDRAALNRGARGDQGQMAAERARFAQIVDQDGQPRCVDAGCVRKIEQKLGQLLSQLLPQKGMQAW